MDVRRRIDRSSDRTAKLAQLFYLPHDWPASPESGVAAWENERIPAGYTYLAQFLAHDCVDTGPATSALAHGRPLHNRRQSPLRLDTLYGAGFDGCAHAIRADDHDPFAAAKLGLGPIEFSSGGRCPFRDLGRAGRDTTAERGGRALIADSRNDNNALVSQMTVLWSQFHNVLVDLIGRRFPRTDRANAQPDQSFYAHLQDAASSATIRTFRNIVRDDLLVRLLHPLAHGDLAGGGTALFPDATPDRLPIEFVHALRLGHALVRPRYRINEIHNREEELLDVLLASARGRPWRMPLDESWAVRWSRFFELGRGRPNYAKRLGPQFSIDLLSAEVFDAIDATGAVGLAYRDLVAGAYGAPGRIDDLAEALCASRPAWRVRSRLLADAAHRRRTLESWLAPRASVVGLDTEDVAAIADDPPLLLFVLLEAAVEADGRHLGLLGSAIIGDPLFRALHEDPVPPASDPRFHIDTSEFEVTDMPGLVQFVRTHAAPDETVLAFV